MIEVKKIVSSQKIDVLRKDYINTLAEPIDGYWESVAIGYSECYEIFYNNIEVGHCSIDKHNTLVQFYVSAENSVYASEIFKYLIQNNNIKKAAVSTKEPEFLSLCLDYQKSVSVDTYLFNDTKKIDVELSDFKGLSFRLAVNEDISEVKDKCDAAFEGYYESLIDNDQLFVIHDGDVLMGIGEFRISKSNPKYGDIGVIVVEEFRKKGVGTYIITRLKEHCYKNNVKPTASCDVKNIASRNTLEKSGLICNHRIVYCEFE